MAVFINPTLAPILVVVGVMLLMLSNLNLKSKVLRVAMVVSLFLAGVEIVFLKVNPWAFLVVALSPLPFFLAVRQGRAHNPLFLLSILMLAISSVFLFVDENGRPAGNYGPAAFVSIICAACIHIASESLRNREGSRASDDPDSVVGLIGEARTDIEPHSAGSVLVEGELWQARSKTPILAGSTVRILRQDGFWLTVKEVEKINKK